MKKQFSEKAIKVIVKIQDYIRHWELLNKIDPDTDAQGLNSEEKCAK